MREGFLDEAADAVRRGAAAPVHAQIEEWFADAVRRGDLSPGDRLPAESDLALRLRVSRMTLRQALGVLATRGVLVRRPGRGGGTFVAEPVVECDLTGLAGFTEQLRKANLRAGARLVQAVTVEPPRPVREALDLPRGGLAHLVVRVRTADRRPLALENSWFPEHLVPDLLDRPLTGSLYALMGSDYGQAPVTATEVLEPVVADSAVAQHLDVPVGSPLMRIVRTARTSSGRAIEHAWDLFRPDRVRISVRSGPDGVSAV